MSELRLNKRMAELKLCSRREADDWIAQGWVEVNGVPAIIGQKVTVSDRISLSPLARQQQAKSVTLILNKPIGYVSTQAEDGYQPASVLVCRERHWQEDPSRRKFDIAHSRNLAAAGRLDIESTGLLVLTQDGRIARQLIGETSSIEKEYLVRVHYQDRQQNIAAIFPERDLARLRHGLSLDGAALKAADVCWQNPEQLRFILTEGKKRQIRRMCEQVGLTVTALKRVRIGQVMLGRLPLGTWRYLGSTEQF